MPLRPLDILLLDDDATMRAHLEEILHELGVGSVRTVASGQEGLVALASAAPSPNILICDLVMPGMDGIEFLRHVAGRGYHGEVVLLSGASGSVLKAAERLAAEHGLGLLGALEKPVDPELLVEILSRSNRRQIRQRPIAELPKLNVQDLRDGLANGCGHVLGMADQAGSTDRKGRRSERQTPAAGRR